MSSVRTLSYQGKRPVQNTSVEANAQQRERYANDVEFREKYNSLNKDNYATDESYRNKINETVKQRSRVCVECPDCDKEMSAGSLYRHVKKSCKGGSPEV